MIIKKIINKKLFLYGLFLLKTDAHIFHSIRNGFQKVCNSLRNWKNRKQKKLAEKVAKKTEKVIQPVANGIVKSVAKGVEHKIEPKSK